MEIVFKSLKKTDIEKRMTIPSKSLEYFPLLSGNQMVDFHLRDETGRVWDLRIYARKNNKYLKPVLNKGWREFVCDKRLCVGDRVVFYKEASGDGVNYSVKVERAVKKVGARYNIELKEA